MTLKVIGTGSFLQGIAKLKTKEADAIGGPRGGLIKETEGQSGSVVTYDSVKGLEYVSGILFSTDDYLGEWQFYIHETLHQ